MLNVEEQISRVEQVFRQLTGRDPKRAEQPLAPIPPEANPEKYVEENLHRLYSLLRGEPAAAELPQVSPRVAIFDTELEWRCLIEIPGVRREDLALQLSQGVLRVNAQRTLPAVEGEAPPAYAETFPCRYERVLPLPPMLRQEALEARVENGILTVKCPKEPAAARRDVRVEVV